MMTSEYNGLIPDIQKPVELSVESWKYGTVEKGKRQLDPLLNWGCFTLGFYCDQIVDYVYSKMKYTKPDIAETIFKEEPIRLNDIAFELQKKVYDISGGYNTFYSLSGSDANEGAIKLAFGYHQSKGDERKLIVSFDDSYHGSTFLNHNLGYSSLMNDPFYGMERYHNVVHISKDFDLDIVDWSNVACIVAETYSYKELPEPSDGSHWEKISKIQKEYGVLLIVDDMFFGGGKTGTYCGWKSLPISPDICTMGKAITGGFFPLSMVLYSDNVKNTLPEKFEWNHGFTYSFYYAGIASALKYIDIIENGLLDNHEKLVKTAIDTIEKCGYTVVNNYGLLFFLASEDSYHSLLVPINADREYFNVLRENLESNTLYSIEEKMYE